MKTDINMSSNTCLLHSIKVLLPEIGNRLKNEKTM